ncbi:MAG: RnfH family protein [Pseudomonadota bacterium]|nr:RnfH family protein [Pseudomonadota bacterium]
MGARALADEGAAITVTVVYARPDQVWRVAVELPAGSRVRDALRASGLAECIGEVDLLAAPVGVFGEACERDRLLRAGDRVEIYRALPVDPKQARRRRAEQARAAAKSRQAGA